MTDKQAITLIEAALANKGFLTELLSKPKAAALKHGIKLTDEEANTLDGMSADEFRTFATEFKSAGDPARRRAAC